jgi:hypothetical protein
MGGGLVVVVVVVVVGAIGGNVVVVTVVGAVVVVGGALVVVVVVVVVFAGAGTHRDVPPVVFSIMPNGQLHFDVFGSGLPFAPHAKFSAAGARRAIDERAATNERARIGESQRRIAADPSTSRASRGNQEFTAFRGPLRHGVSGRSPVPPLRRRRLRPAMRRLLAKKGRLQPAVTSAPISSATTSSIERARRTATTSPPEMNTSAASGRAL